MCRMNKQLWKGNGLFFQKIITPACEMSGYQKIIYTIQNISQSNVHFDNSKADLWLDWYICQY